MALRQVRIGNLIDIHQYDDDVQSSAIDTDNQPIEIGQATTDTQAVRQDQLPALGDVVSAADNISDNRAVRGDGGGKGIQDSDIEITDGGVIRSVNSIWWTCHKLPASEFSPGASGATWIDPDANTLGGYNLDANNEYLFINFILCSDWDANSDPELMIWFETDVDNSSGAIGDKVVMNAECYVKDIGDVTTTSQSLSEDIVIDQAPQYKLYNFTFTIDYDDLISPLSIGSIVTMRINFDVTNSDITDIIFNKAIFRYKTKNVNIEV